MTCTFALLLSATRLAAAFALITLVTGSGRAQTTIDTIPGNNSVTTGGAVFGQTFTTPTDNVLTSFAFQIVGSPRSLTFSLYQYVNATNTTLGNALFTSAPTAVGTVEGQRGFFFDTGNLTLATGTVYAALLTGSANGYSGRVNIFNGDAYRGGTFIYGNTTTGPFVNESQTVDSPVDLAFRATFVPTAVAAAPEPGTIALLLTAGVPLIDIVRRRAKSRA